MNNTTKLIIGILIFGLFLAGSMLAYSVLKNRVELPAPTNEASNNQPAASSQENQEPQPIPAPDFQIETADGVMVQLSDFIGKPIVLNFWASWCPPCKAEMPDFQRVYEELGDEVTFIMVDLVDGGRETKEKGAQFIAQQGFTFPVYYDTTQQAAITYGVRSIPTTYFIDPAGNIITGSMGAMDEKRLRYAVELIQNSDADPSPAPTYKKITPQQAKELLKQPAQPVVLDVRTQEEYDQGHIPGALLIPDNQIATQAETNLPEKDALILVYCRSGRRSQLAANSLLEMGYTNVYDFGGINDWPYEITP